MSTIESQKDLQHSGRINQGVVVLAGSTVLLVAAGVALGSYVILSGAVILASMYAISNILKTPYGITVRRTVEKNSVWVGDEIRVDVRIVIEKGIGPVFARCPIPPVMELVEGSNMLVVWKGLQTKSVDVSFTFRATIRGVFTLDPVRWEAHHPFRLRTPHSETEDEVEEIVVRTGIREISRVANVRGLAVNPRPMLDMSVIGNQTTEFREIRQYVLGDSIKAVNWRATARKATGTQLTNSDLFVNEYEREGKKAIWLFLDTTAAMTVGSTLVNPLEHAIEAAGTLSFYYLRRGYQVGAHFSNRRAKLIHLDSGQAQLRKLNRELLELSGEDGEYDLRHAVQVCRHQILRYVPECFVITRLDIDEPRQGSEIPPSLESLVAGVKALTRYGSRGHNSVKVNIVAIAGYSYTGSEGQGNSIARELRRMETRLLSRAVRRYGVNVIDWDPTQSRFSDLLLGHALNKGRTL